MSMLRMVQGTTRAFALGLKGPDGEPYIMEEGMVAVFALKHGDAYNTERALVKTITHAVDGEYYLELAAADTADLEPGWYEYDVGIQYGDHVLYNVIEAQRFYLAPGCVKLGDGA